MNALARIAGYLQYLIISGGIALIRVLPYRISLAVGRTCGLLAWGLIPLHREIAAIQILQALGPKMAHKTARRSFMHLGDVIVDTIRFAYLDELALRERIMIEGREHIEGALASGRGVMWFTCHMNWEQLAHLPQLMDIEFSVMGDIMKNPQLQSIIEDLRTRSSFTLLPPKGGMLARLTEELRQGRTIGMVIDQRGNRSNRLFCDLFGLPAPTSPAPALIALRGDALLLPIVVIKQDETYTIRFEKPIDARDFGDDFNQIEGLKDGWRSHAVQNLSDCMQTWVGRVAREWPEQYFWVHSRWLRRSDIRRLLKAGGDFRERVCRQAEEFGHTDRDRAHRGQGPESGLPSG